MAHPMRNDMNAAAKKQTAKFEEVAGKTLTQARELAARYGYGEPVFTSISGGLCVLRFEVKA